MFLRDLCYLSCHVMSCLAFIIKVDYSFIQSSIKKILSLKSAVVASPPPPPSSPMLKSHNHLTLPSST